MAAPQAAAHHTKSSWPAAQCCFSLWPNRHLHLRHLSAYSCHAPFRVQKQLPLRHPPEQQSLLQALAVSAPTASAVRLSHAQPSTAGNGAEDASAYLESLSHEQKAAVTGQAVHMRVVAGPGSGKTRVLTARVAHLIATNQAKPYEIMAITFTNKAAKELQERLALMLGPTTARSIATGTFHSVAARMLRLEMENLPLCGCSTSYSICDQEDSKALLAGFIRENAALFSIPVDSKKGPKGKDVNDVARVMQNWISSLKGALPSCYGMSGQQLLETVLRLDDDVPGVQKKVLSDPKCSHNIIAAYDGYASALRAADSVDFDDLLSLAVAALRQPAVVAKYRRRFRWLLVDEFQDTNAAQYELVKLLALSPVPNATEGTVFVVGDPDQAIYRWRGADVRKMRTSFVQDYPSAATLALLDNYRSTPQVLHAAERVIGVAGAENREPLRPLLSAGPDIKVVEVQDGLEEPAFVAKTIRELQRREGLPLRGMAVLFRIHRQARVFEEALVRAGIKYVLVSGVPFWARTEVKDVMAYLRLAASPTADVVSLARVINVPQRGLGRATVEKLAAWAKDQGLSLPAAFFKGCQESLGLAGLPPIEELGNISARAHAAVADFRDVIWRLRQLAATQTVDQVILHLLAWVDYETHVLGGKCSPSAKGRKEGDEQQRWGNVMQLVSAAQQFALRTAPLPDLDDSGMQSPGPRQHLDDCEEYGSVLAEEQGARAGLQALRDFLAEATLQTEALEDAAKEGADAVLLMTLHAAKGLEFDAVFMPGMEEKCLPLESRGADAEEAAQELAEERRLCYVGITRAKRHLYLLHAQRRWLFGELVEPEPSRFLGPLRHSKGVSALLRSSEGSREAHRSSSSSGSITLRANDSGGRRSVTSGKSRHNSISAGTVRSTRSSSSAATTSPLGNITFSSSSSSSSSSNDQASNSALYRTNGSSTASQTAPGDGDAGRRWLNGRFVVAATTKSRPALK